LASLRRPQRPRPLQGGSEISPLPSEGFPSGQVLWRRGVSEQLAISLPREWPSAYYDSVGTPTPIVLFRRSISWPNFPLLTLQSPPHGRPHIARGQCGSLLLTLEGLDSHFSSQRKKDTHPQLLCGLGSRNQKKIISVSDKVNLTSRLKLTVTQNISI
jgi:hypothetical protein